MERFHFNLLHKTFIDQERVKNVKFFSLLQGILLLLIFAVIAVILTYLEIFVLNSRLDIVKNEIKNLKNEINSQKDMIILKKNLKTKMDVLNPFVDFDINLTKLIKKANRLVDNYVGDIQISSYSRESDGSLGVIMFVNNIDINQIKKILLSDKDVKDVFVRNVTFNDKENKYSIVLRIFLNDEN